MTQIPRVMMFLIATLTTPLCFLDLIVTAEHAQRLNVTMLRGPANCDHTLRLPLT